MTEKNWLVTNNGQCMTHEVVPQTEDLLHPYWLHRFLSDIEDILDRITDDHLRLQAICPLMRRWVTSSSWLQILSVEPNPETGWEVLMLYDEPFFPLTVQLVAWVPGMSSPIHNHACWGLVALLRGKEKNTFWQRSPTPELPDLIKPVDDCLLEEGDILCLMPDTIHQITSLSNEPTISFNLYGETNFMQRFEFDLTQGTAKNF